ncbi:Sua5/YciO/YrdC/YwlC family protein, partial [[Eubacterium] siraeum]|nr:Sua5/YciO/YrdC/YwlC family protein [[Eubacterium] siraeum]
MCEAAELIKKGEVVAIPPVTVYGLAADAYNPEAC